MLIVYITLDISTSLKRKTWSTFEPWVELVVYDVSLKGGDGKCIWFV